MIDINELRAAVKSIGIMAISTQEVFELLDRIEAAEKERDALRTELNEIRYGVAVAHDTIKALRAKIEQMERQEPAGVVQWIKGWPVVNAHDGVILEPNKPLYALPGAKAQPAPSLASGDVSLISEGKTPTTLLVAVADLVAQMEIVSRVGFVDTPEDKDSCAAFCVAEGTWLELMKCVESLAASLAAAPEAKP